MKSKDLLVLLGNQLFPISEIKRTNPNQIFMAEDYDLCTYEKHHKLKILMFLCAMREKRDELIANNFNVFYSEINSDDFSISYEEKLKKYIIKNKIKHIKFFEIEDKFFEKRMIFFANENNLEITFYQSPMFLESRDDFKRYAEDKKSLSHANFYKNIRKKLNILVNESFQPLGGKWSFDEENRKKIPKNINLPKQPINNKSKYSDEITKFINYNFSNHPGKINHLWMPITRVQALKSFDEFLKVKFKNFGSYEDAILIDDNFLFHSALSSSLNLGLITPKELINKVLKFIKLNDIPINSSEGFIRQIIGWREFIRGVYHVKGEEQQKSNFFKFSNRLNDNWYSGKTGIPPLDDAINFSHNYGYTHHINRLMILSNIMTLSEINPNEVYRWFMEMYVDSSDWVMVPNVYGMGTYADGGIFSTKPYICGSNYILKMSNYKKNEWCDTVDGLYWRFVDKNFDKIKNNHRLSFMKKTLERMDVDRKRTIFKKAENFINDNTC
ncbi:MAG: cryptochrome/photolyase family protein [Rhizobiales bacterium TMED168]|nr:MAG: cryptochrome/photolyase family protein [Rhizobiales bacterium TMED168]|tara:strand:+ start:8720 stop:10216 length:1497 start_codon:yes stop_codon:yes gene_type:complete